MNSQFILLVLKYSLFFFPSKNISLPQGRQLKAPPSLILGSQVIADTTPFRCGSWETSALSEKTKYLSSSPHNTHYTMIQQRPNESSVRKEKWWETCMEQLWDPGTRHCELPSSTNTLRQGGVSWYILILLSGSSSLVLDPKSKDLHSRHLCLVHKTPWLYPRSIMNILFLVAISKEHSEYTFPRLGDTQLS